MALRLVCGRPPCHLPARRYGWLAETYIEQEIPSAVIDVAHSLAQILLDDGDAGAVVKFAHLALDVDRYDERPCGIFRWRMSSVVNTGRSSFSWSNSRNSSTSNVTTNCNLRPPS